MDSVSALRSCSVFFLAQAMKMLNRTASKPIRELEREPGRRELDARLNDKLMKREIERGRESDGVVSYQNAVRDTRPSGRCRTELRLTESVGETWMIQIFRKVTKLSWPVDDASWLSITIGTGAWTV